MNAPSVSLARALCPDHPRIPSPSLRRRADLSFFRPTRYRQPRISHPLRRVLIYMAGHLAGDARGDTRVLLERTDRMRRVVRRDFGSPCSRCTRVCVLPGGSVHLQRVFLCVVCVCRAISVGIFCTAHPARSLSVARSPPTRAVRSASTLCIYIGKIVLGKLHAGVKMLINT